jgi:putative nucleotidyltransferase with HDIG domain
MDTEEYKARIDLLYEFAQEAGSISDVSELLKRILRVTQQNVEASAASLLLVDEKTGGLYFQVALGEAGDEIAHLRMVAGSGIAGWVARKAESVLVNNVTGDSRFDSNVDEFTGFTTMSIIAVPMMRGQQVIGVLEALNKAGGGEFDERDMRVMEGLASTEALILLASMAETAIGNISLLALDEALQDGYRSIAEAWAAAVDDKDSYAYAHSQRVRDYAMLAAAGLSLPAQEMQDIEFGALFHDVGKIGIDDNILNKPGPLTDREWSAMRDHCRKGAVIVSEIPFLEKAQDIVLRHHERYDGTGYPDGLKGEEIPPGARLVAVADAFDTMTTEHAYRPALGVDEAIKELKNGAGKQFCPLAVEAFITAFLDVRGELEVPGDEGADRKEDGKKKKAGKEEKEKPRKEKERKEESVRLRKDDTEKLLSEMFEGDIRLVVPLTAGNEEVRRFKKNLQEMEGVKIVLTGASEEEGHIILLTVSRPMALAGIINGVPLVTGVTKHGKDIVVELENKSGS